MTELTRAMLLILLVLRTGERHGYAIMQEIAQLTGGEYEVSTGTLYRSLAQMDGAGLIDKTPDQDVHDYRRKRYSITEQGREAAANELQRMKRLIEAVEESA